MLLVDKADGLETDYQGATMIQQKKLTEQDFDLQFKCCK